MVSRRTPRSDLPTRPPALIRGPSAKPRSRHSGARLRRAASARAARPMLRRPAITLSPWVTKARLRPRSWATSATVPSATRSSSSISFGSARLGEEAAGPQRPEQGRAEQEGHADRGEMAVRGAFLALVEPVRIDDGEAVGEAARAFVMVDDDDVDARRLGHGERLEGLGAAIDGDDQRRAALGDPDQRLARRAVALHQPVGDIGLGVEPELAQQADQQGRRGGAVDVIIAEDGDRLAGLDRVGEPRRGLVHVAEDGRIGHEVAQASGGGGAPAPRGRRRGRAAVGRRGRRAGSRHPCRPPPARASARAGRGSSGLTPQTKDGLVSIARRLGAGGAKGNRAGIFPVEKPAAAQKP